MPRPFVNPKSFGFAIHFPFIGKRFLLLVCLLVCAVCAHAQEKYIDSIKARIYRDLQSESRTGQLDETVTNTRKLLTRNDSCWSDVHYETADPTHLGRIVLYAKAYTHAGSRWYHNSEVYNCMVKTLSFWFKTKRVHWNWYSNVIGAPLNTGRILILMDGGGKPLPEALTQRLLAAMDFNAAADPRCRGGANQTDVALHYLYRGCLVKNLAVIDTAARNSVGRIQYFNNADGIQYDNSFYAHGPQEAIASYGSVYVHDLYSMAYYLHDTPFALKGRGLAILSGYYLNTYLPSVRNGYFDFNVLGRGISRPGALNGSHQALLNEKAPLVDPANAARWKTARAIADGGMEADYLITPQHAHFWKSDYVQHIRQQYSFNVRMSSIRTLRTETGNKENLLGNFLADGSTNIQRRGNEYYNIMPVWEWDKIPGTTVPDSPGDSSALTPKAWGIPGTTSFVGGVSDGKYGASAYDMHSKDVGAKKAWFFFDGEVVCLGAGIKTSGKKELITTLNQCWLNGPVIVSTPQQTTTLKPGEDRLIDSPLWLLHDSVGYFFPMVQHLRVSTVTQTGSWSRVNGTTSPKPVSGAVFKAWLEHKQADDSYAYIVVPGLADAKAMQGYNQQQITILANTDKVQAVWHRGLDLLQVVLYKAGKFQLGDISIKADEPCILMLTGAHNRNSQLYLADPQQTVRKITLELTLPDNNALKPLTVDLPAGVFAGATVGYQLDSTGAHLLPDVRDVIVK